MVSCGLGERSWIRGEKKTVDRTLFQGTAWYYARYRPPYPRVLTDLLCQRFGLDGGGRLLDLGCGTGELALPLSGLFQQVVAVDPDQEMLAEGRRKAAEAGVANVTWQQARAEELPVSTGPFRLVTIGSAFHWMDGEVVLELARGLLVDGGGLALVSARSWWNPREEWHGVVIGLVKKYLGEERRAGQGTFKDPGVSFQTVLAQHGFAPVEEHHLQEPYRWTVDTILGYLYSTSFCSRRLLGARLGEFEGEMRRALLALNPQGTFPESIPVQVLIAFKGRK